MLPVFSICLPFLSNTHFRNYFDSILVSKCRDFEVIVNSVSDQFYVRDQVSDHDIRIIKKTKSFASGMISVKASSGNRIIIFDDTMLTSDTLLGRVSGTSEDMIVIAEKDIGNGLLVRFSNSL